MAARRCPPCGINYPTSVFDCPVCDEKTSWASNVDPDADWQLAVDLATQTPSLSPEAEKIERWRLQECLRLGYDVETSLSLTVSDADWHLLADLVRAGCPLPLAARIA